MSTKPGSSKRFFLLIGIFVGLLSVLTVLPFMTPAEHDFSKLALEYVD